MSPLASCHSKHVVTICSRVLLDRYSLLRCRAVCTEYSALRQVLSALDIGIALGEEVHLGHIARFQNLEEEDALRSQVLDLGALEEAVCVAIGQDVRPAEPRRNEQEGEHATVREGFCLSNFDDRIRT